jgi:hypothetical protein
MQGHGKSVAVRRPVPPSAAYLSVALMMGCQGASGSRDDSPTAQPTAAELRLSGKSALEDRYVYGAPDEGGFTIPLTLDLAMPGEFSIVEPSMVSGRADLRVEYSKARNVVEFRLDAQGLPYRPSFHKSVDDSNPFNRQLATVTDARWQLWLAGTLFGRQHEDLYYRAGNPRTFLGTRYDMQPLGPVSPPISGSYELFQGNARQMVGLPPFDPQPNGDVHVRFTLPYDRMKDDSGTPGAIQLFLPLNGCEPDALSNYWTSSALPANKFMTWDTFLESIWDGEGIEFMLTAEPLPKPDGFAFRSSGFVGWANVYPAVVPEGYGVDFCTFGTLVPTHEGSHQLSPWPTSSRRHLCRRPR